MLVLPSFSILALLYASLVSSCSFSKVPHKNARQRTVALLKDQDFLTKFFIDKNAYEYTKGDVEMVADNLKPDDIDRRLCTLIVVLYQKHCRKLGFNVQFAETCSEKFEPACPEGLLGKKLFSVNPDHITQVYYMLPPGRLRSEIFESILESLNEDSFRIIVACFGIHLQVFPDQLQYEMETILEIAVNLPDVAHFIRSALAGHLVDPADVRDTIATLARPSLLAKYRGFSNDYNWRMTLITSLLSDKLDQSQEVLEFLRDTSLLLPFNQILARYPLAVFEVDDSKLPEANYAKELKRTALHSLLFGRHNLRVKKRLLDDDFALNDIGSFAGDDMELVSTAAWFMDDLFNAPFGGNTATIINNLDIRKLNKVSFHDDMAIELYPRLLRSFPSTLSKTFLNSPLAQSPCNPHVFFGILSMKGENVQPLIDFFYDHYPVMSDSRVQAVKAFINLIADCSFLPSKKLLATVCTRGMFKIYSKGMRKNKRELAPNQSQDQMLHSLVFRIGSFATIYPTLAFILESAAWLFFPRRFLELKGVLNLLGSIHPPIHQMLQQPCINKRWLLDHYLCISDYSIPNRHVSTLVTHMDKEMIAIVKREMHLVQVKRRLGQIARWCEEGERNIYMAALLKELIDGRDYLKAVSVAFLFVRLRGKSPKSSMLDVELERIDSFKPVYYLQKDLMAWKDKEGFIEYIFPILTPSERLHFLAEYSLPLTEIQAILVHRYLGSRTMIVAETMIARGLYGDTVNPITAKNAIALIDLFVESSKSKTDARLMEDLTEIVIQDSVKFKYFVQLASKYENVLLAMLNNSYLALSLNAAKYIFQMYPIEECCDEEKRDVIKALATVLNHFIDKKDFESVFPRDDPRLVNARINFRNLKCYSANEFVNKLIKHNERHYNYFDLVSCSELTIIETEKVLIPLPSALSVADLHCVLMEVYSSAGDDSADQKEEEDDSYIYLFTENGKKHLNFEEGTKIDTLQGQCISVMNIGKVSGERIVKFDNSKSKTES